MALNETETGQYDDDEFDPSADAFRNDKLGEGIDPVGDARKPGQRRGIFLVGGSFLVIALILLVITLRSSGGSKTPKTAKADSTAENVVAKAPIENPDSVKAGVNPSASNSAPTRIIDEEAIRSTLASSQKASDSAINSTLPASGAQGGTTNGVPMGNTPGNVQVGNQGPLQGGSTPGGTPRSGPSYAEVNSQGLSLNQDGSQAPAQTPAERAQIRYERRAQAIAAARAQDSARSADYAAWLEGETKRLSAPTRVPLGGGSDLTSVASDKTGQSRFANGATAAVSVEKTGADSTNADTDAENVIDGVPIPPGTRARAETMTEFRTDIQGNQTVQIRLTEPLRAGGKTIFPAGTLGYGKASASPGSAGRSAYVQLVITTFQTRQGKIYRGLSAQAGDPETLAMAIKAKTDRRLAEVVARGVAATVLDVGFSAASQRMAYRMAGQSQAGGGSGLVATPTDVALLQAQDKARGIIQSAVGDENSVKPAVVLRKGTDLILFFGF